MKLTMKSSVLYAPWSRCSVTLVAFFGTSIVLFAMSVVSAEPKSLVPQNSKVEFADPDTSSQTAFAQMESEAVAFVKQHHPELVSLLQLLKAMKEKEYDAAIRDIDRARKRLESLVKREPETYQIELESWKIQSKVDLLLAKGFAQDKAFNTKTLRSLLQDQVENQKRRLKNEQSNLAKRQRQINEQLEKVEGHESEKVDQQFAALMKRVDSKVGKPNRSKPETKPTKEVKERQK